MKLFNRLSAIGVRYGVYKNANSVRGALAGLVDLDLLVAAKDAENFRNALFELKALRGVASRFHDNSRASREDWFVPDFSAGTYLHLDVSIDLAIGFKYNKCYMALTYDDVAEWQMAYGNLPIPTVTPREEARIAVLRSILRLSRGASGWIELDRSLTDLLIPLMVGHSDGLTFSYRVGSEEVSCAVRLKGKRVEIERRSVERLRQQLRRHSARRDLTPRGAWLIHLVRQFSYRAERTITFFSPAIAAQTRALVPQGLVVAIIAPDGLGKSTQVARLAKIFQKKFRCTTAYLGSGDGGWRVRRIIGGVYRRWRNSRGPNVTSDVPAEGLTVRRRLKLLAAALWGFGTAFERYVSVRIATRLASSGAIVISDRWPQNLQPGLLDGPRVAPPSSLWVARLASSLERNIFRQMERYEPALTIHLDGDFSISQARKPGGIDQQAFQSRLALMQEMRRRDQNIKVVDATANLDDVTRNLFQCIWLYLWGRSVSPS